VREQRPVFPANLAPVMRTAATKATLRHMYLAREVVSLNVDPICKAAQPFVPQHGNNPNTPETNRVERHRGASDTGMPSVSGHLVKIMFIHIAYIAAPPVGGTEAWNFCTRGLRNTSRLH
jgi:hypothetical protein